MTSLERIRCAARRQPVDRVPVAPYVGNHGAHVAGVPIGLYCRSGRIMAESQFEAWRIYGQDAVVAQSDNYYIAEGFGVEVAAHCARITRQKAAAALGKTKRVWGLVAVTIRSRRHCPRTSAM